MSDTRSAKIRGSGGVPSDLLPETPPLDWLERMHRAACRATCEERPCGEDPAVPCACAPWLEGPTGSDYREMLGAYRALRAILREE